MPHDHEVAELVSAFEELQARAVRVAHAASIQQMQQAIAELDRHGAEALPIMTAAYQRVEARIARLETAA